MSSSRHGCSGRSRLRSGSNWRARGRRTFGHYSRIAETSQWVTTQKKTEKKAGHRGPAIGMQRSAERGPRCGRFLRGAAEMLVVRGFVAGRWLSRRGLAGGPVGGGGNIRVPRSPSSIRKTFIANSTTSGVATANSRANSFSRFRSSCRSPGSFSVVGAACSAAHDRTLGARPGAGQRDATKLAETGGRNAAGTAVSTSRAMARNRSRHAGRRANEGETRGGR